MGSTFTLYLSISALGPRSFATLSNMNPEMLRQTSDNDVLSARIGNRNIFIASIYLVEKFVRNRKKVVRKSNLGDK